MGARALQCSNQRASSQPLQKNVSVGKTLGQVPFDLLQFALQRLAFEAAFSLKKNPCRGDLQDLSIFRLEFAGNPVNRRLPRWRTDIEVLPDQRRYLFAYVVGVLNDVLSRLARA